MYAIVSSLLRKLKVKPIVIDNHIFQLHYKATMFLMVVFSLLITQKQYFGDPIDCKSSTEVKILDTYCWIRSTYTVLGEGGPYPGITTDYDRNNKRHEVRHHTYYQWIALVLYLQALMFYIPRYMWKVWEGGKVKMLVEGMHLPIMDEGELETKKNFLVSFVRKNFHKQDFYFYKFVFCECLNFVNIILQIYLTNRFVGYEFTTYGLDVVREMQKPAVFRRDDLELVFPKVTKCVFEPYGSSGTMEKIAGLCILPINIFSEKIYVVLWFWFMALTIVTALGLVFRVGTFFLPFRRVLLRAKATLAHPDDVDIVAQKCSAGDWFFIYQIAKNMDENAFRLFLEDFVKDL